jgi:hypothetical protein
MTTARNTDPASPLVPHGDHSRASHGFPPAEHTPEEVSTLLHLVTAQRPRPHSVVIGCARDSRSQAAAHAWVQAWESTGRIVVDVVDWPESAASWLRPAKRLVAGAPDCWVVTGSVQGWAQTSRRLRHSTNWSPCRTYGFAAVGVPELVELAGAATVEGLSGATRDGRTWHIHRGLIFTRTHAAHSTPPRPP